MDEFPSHCCWEMADVQKPAQEGSFQPWAALLCKCQGLGSQTLLWVFPHRGGPHLDSFIKSHYLCAIPQTTEEEESVVANGIHI